MKSQGYLGAAIATSVGNFLRMLWVIFKRLGWKWRWRDGTLSESDFFSRKKMLMTKKTETVECVFFSPLDMPKFLLQIVLSTLVYYLHLWTCSNKSTDMCTSLKLPSLELAIAPENGRLGANSFPFGANGKFLRENC